MAGVLAFGCQTAFRSLREGRCRRVLACRHPWNRRLLTCAHGPARCKQWNSTKEQFWLLWQRTEEAA